LEPPFFDYEDSFKNQRNENHQIFGEKLNLWRGTRVRDYGKEANIIESLKRFKQVEKGRGIQDEKIDLGRGE